MKRKKKTCGVEITFALAVECGGERNVMKGKVARTDVWTLESEVTVGNSGILRDGILVGNIGSDGIKSLRKDENVSWKWQC